MELIIDRVHEQHFRRHWFVAENEMGTAEIMINVTAGKNPQVLQTLMEFCGCKKNEICKPFPPTMMN